ncbi:MAG TPA: hypothetical protein VGH54_09565 [Mycobacterium sp.]|jgi:hypothetical protein|uniref:hypothetical protein n=1 Tax=Mycobacterium sp. TaxID=1785 RepID=UPI002F3F9167
MSQRVDLLSEVDTTLDGSGGYIGPWIDSAGVDKIRVTFRCASAGVLYVDHSSDQTNVLYEGLEAVLGSSIGGLSEQPLGARYFRVRADGDTANASLRLAVRALI